MSSSLPSAEEALLALANPSGPVWADVFRFLAGKPETARLMLETFRRTPEQMGVEPGGSDPVTGKP